MDITDHIALPSKSGAMENWGLITYSEFYLCASPETTAVTGQITVAAVIAHELAHQVSTVYRAQQLHFLFKILPEP